MECGRSAGASVDPLGGGLTAVSTQQDEAAVGEVPAGVVTAARGEGVGLRPPARAGQDLTAKLGRHLKAPASQEAILGVAVSGAAQWRQGTAEVGVRHEELHCSLVGISSSDQDTCQPPSRSSHAIQPFLPLLSCVSGMSLQEATKIVKKSSLSQVN